MTAPHPFVPSPVDLGCGAYVQVPQGTLRCGYPPSAPCHSAPHRFVRSNLGDWCVAITGHAETDGHKALIACGAVQDAPCHQLTHSAASPPVAALPEANGVNAGSPPSLSASEPPIDAAGGGGDRAATPALSFLSTLNDGIEGLMRSSERAGYERGYLACVGVVVARVKKGKPVDGDFLLALLTHAKSDAP